MVIRRGQIYYATPDPVRGREQSGRRPVLVVSDDAINELPLVVTVIAGTSGRNVSKDYSTNVRITAGECGLPRDTVFKWTSSWYDRYPGNTTSDDMFGQKVRVLRGGAWYSGIPSTFGGAFRGGGDPGLRVDGIGWRCARSL